MHIILYIFNNILFILGVAKYEPFIYMFLLLTIVNYYLVFKNIFMEIKILKCAKRNVFKNKLYLD